MNEYYDELYKYIETLRVIDTHCHHMAQPMFDDFSIETAFSACYVAWNCDFDVNDFESVKGMLENMATNTYFTWYARAFSEIYGEDKPLNAENWFRIKEKIAETYQADRFFHLKLLKEKCRYDRIILDNYSDPGNDLDVPELFAPTFRCDSFLCSCMEGKGDENGNSAYKYFVNKPQNIDEYIEMMDHAVKEKKQAGCCALKIAIAYQRGLDFERQTREDAQKAFGNPDATVEDKKRFGDYIMFALCKIAAKYDIPLQIHTGLGILEKSNAMQLKPLIHSNPKTQFVLFHASYPWMADVLGLAHNYQNVYPDLCWLPIISTSAAERFLAEALEVTDLRRLTWGCDTWNSEESYGALLAMRHVLAKVLSEKALEGEYTLEYAKKVASGILHDNAKRLYKL